MFTWELIKQSLIWDYHPKGQIMKPKYKYNYSHLEKLLTTLTK